MLMTVNNTPKTYLGKTTIVLNDVDIHITVRNIAMLLLLNIEDVEVSADVITHLWYSARLKPSHVSLLKTHVQSKIDQVVEQLKNVKGDALQAKTFSIGKSTIRVILFKYQWASLKNMLAKILDPQTTEASRKSIVVENKDEVDRVMYEIKSKLHRRRSAMHYREHGVLLPFGSCCEAFTAANP